MAKNISILGSTGSIGTQTLEVVDEINSVNIVGLSTNENIDLLEKQIRKYKPKIVAVMNVEKAKDLRQNINDLKTKVVSGIDGLIEVATLSEIEMVLTSVVGSVGLLPTVKAIEAGKNIALANKETLVSAGKIITDLAKKHKINIYPVDSEHCAIFQCIQGNAHEEIHKILLTASGGPFRNKTKEELKSVTIEQALKHPNWSMGRKITVDSATLMNKGLEVIEAKWLFDLEPKQIEVIIHPQSIIHSMVEYIDGSIIAQLGEPDMKTAIQYALTYPHREKNNFKKLDLLQQGNLSFEKPNMENFHCLQLAINAMVQGGSVPAVMNAANEAVVDLFLNRKISFLDIPCYIEKAINKHEFIANPNLDQILKLDLWAKEFIYSLI